MLSGGGLLALSNTSFVLFIVYGITSRIRCARVGRCRAAPIIILAGFNLNNTACGFHWHSRARLIISRIYTYCSRLLDIHRCNFFYFFFYFHSPLLYISLFHSYTILYSWCSLAIISCFRSLCIPSYPPSLYSIYTIVNNFFYPIIRFCLSLTIMSFSLLFLSEIFVYVHSSLLCTKANSHSTIIIRGQYASAGIPKAHSLFFFSYAPYWGRYAPRHATMKDLFL